MKPKRIQRKRVKGWKMPENTIFVGRPTKFGNYWFYEKVKNLDDIVYNIDYGAMTVKEMFKIMKKDWLNCVNFDEWIAPLKGKNLCCWCPLDQPCHADILLEIAND